MMSRDRIVCLFLLVVLLIVSSGIIVAACGSNQVQTRGSLSTPVVTPRTASGSIPTATQSITPTLKSLDHVQNCGKIKLSPLHRFEDAGLAQQAGTCFWQAFQQCHAATLTFQPLSVDTITIHTFLIEKKEGGCTITDSVSHAVVPRPATTATYTCTGVIQTKTALHFTSCGAEGDVIVPQGQ